MDWVSLVLSLLPLALLVPGPDFFRSEPKTHCARGDV
jgi:hypothetical protein